MTPYPASYRWRILHYSWIAFCCTFFAWFAFAPVAILVQRDLGLSNVQLGWITTAGVLLTIPGRILIGSIVDRIGPRKAYSILLATLAVPVALLGFARSFEELIILRLVIGLVGCGFIVGVRLVADWFPARQVGFAEGIYGGWGNAGSGVAAMAIPVIASAFGWRVALSSAAIPMFVWAFIFWRGVSDVPAGHVFKRTPREAGYSAWKDRNARILAFCYLATFGSEICVVSFLPKFFTEKFGVLDPIRAGLYASIFGIANVVARPLGGYLADRWGGKRILLITLAGSSLGYLMLGLSPTLGFAIFAVAITSLVVQAGCGTVYALVPLLHPTSTGQVAGLVGAGGNVGGVLFPLIFGYGLQATGGSYLPGFAAVAGVALVSLIAARFLRTDEASCHPGHHAKDGASTEVRGAWVRVRMQSRHGGIAVPKLVVSKTREDLS